MKNPGNTAIGLFFRENSLLEMLLHFMQLQMLPCSTQPVLI